MTEEMKAAYVIAAVVRALIRAMGMQAENDQRKLHGLSVAYDERAFTDLIQDEGISHNSVIRAMYE